MGELNYCTKWIKGTWNHCCKKHDECYSDKITPKKECDRKLYDCVKDSCYVCGTIALLMWVAVTMAGNKYFIAARKSDTAKRALIGVSALATFNIDQKDIISVVDKISGLNGWGTTVHTWTVVITSALVIFGVIKGKIDGENKPKLEDR